MNYKNYYSHVFTRTSIVVMIATAFLVAAVRSLGDLAMNGLHLIEVSGRYAMPRNFPLRKLRSSNSTKSQNENYKPVLKFKIEGNVAVLLICFLRRLGDTFLPSNRFIRAKFSIIENSSHVVLTDMSRVKAVP